VMSAEMSDHLGYRQGESKPEGQANRRDSSIVHLIRNSLDYASWKDRKQESLHMQLRKTIKSQGHFPSDEAATKLLWLALRNITAGKVRSTREWEGAMNQFAVLYADRFTNPMN